MDRVGPIVRPLVDSAPSVGAAARTRRLERDQEHERGKGRDDHGDREDATEDCPDDGLPHVDVLA